MFLQVNHKGYGFELVLREGKNESAATGAQQHEFPELQPERVFQFGSTSNSSTSNSSSSSESGETKTESAKDLFADYSYDYEGGGDDFYDYFGGGAAKADSAARDSYQDDLVQPTESSAAAAKSEVAPQHSLDELYQDDDYYLY